MERHEQLLRATAAQRDELTGLPFIRDAVAGRLQREDYVAFLGEAYHHVKHTLPLLMACGARLPERLEWLRAEMGHYIEEETGHQEWILNDIAACGENAEAVRRAVPSLQVEVMVAYAYDTIARGNPVGFLGMVLVLEGTSIQAASQAAEAIQRTLGLPKKAFSYLTSHGALDVAHTEFFAGLVNRLDDPADLAAVIHCARVFYRLYGDIFRRLDALRAQRAAAVAEAA